MAESDRFLQQKILTVTELNHLVRDALEGAFPLFWISGEISNFTRAASGHWYFSLKDTSAQVRCVMFKGRNAYVDFDLREGDHIEARCNISFYEPRGEFQLNVEFIRKAGLGALFEAFEKLKKKLAQEGLFDAANKRPIPAYPKTIGIVTSPDAAALRDVLTTLRRRNPNIRIIIYPTPVQGKSAATLIAKAIRTASERREVNTLIICRGGGSIEDLWQFNEEIVARAVAECPIPTISGVGHETDFTICDFVADARAATPTAAAELASVDLQALRAYVAQLWSRLERRMDIGLQSHAQRLDFLARRLISPQQQIKLRQDHVDHLKIRLTGSFQGFLKVQKLLLANMENSLVQLNPDNVLARGFAILHNMEKAPITSINEVSLSEKIEIQLKDGKLAAQVLAIDKSHILPD
ncbi:MAG TPA: exodeoxyribonuclease VII large subunit [Methylophilus sp.]|nr:exodeoxyribonuclease VII large subunit [Methylophilus sp.]HQQ32825.1 exodeoxyribonuclease VII large subunit [Methylophilus sp.]